jgi:hypothetical protein
MIPSRSAVWATAQSPDSYRAGDIAVFVASQSHVCHRILYIRRTPTMKWFYFKGDRSWKSDGWIPAYRLVGKVVQVNQISTESRRWRLTQPFWLWLGRGTDLLYRLLPARLFRKPELSF